MKIYLEFHDEKSDKFWEGSVEENTLTTRWGKIGTKGQSKEKKCNSEVSAIAELDKAAKSKIKKGYKKVSNADTKNKGLGFRDCINKLNTICGDFISLTNTKLTIGGFYGQFPLKDKYEDIAYLLSYIYKLKNFKKIKTVEIQPNWEENGYYPLDLLNTIDKENNIETLKLLSGDYDLSWIEDTSSQVNKFDFKKLPKLNNLVIEGTLGGVKLINPSLKSLDITSSNDSIKDIFKSLKRSKLDSLEVLKVSASPYHNATSFITVDKSLSDIVNNCVSLKNLTIGTRDVVDWKKLLPFELLSRLTDLNIQIDGGIYGEDEVVKKRQKFTLELGKHLSEFLSENNSINISIGFGNGFDEMDDVSEEYLTSSEIQKSKEFTGLRMNKSVQFVNIGYRVIGGYE